MGQLAIPLLIFASQAGAAVLEGRAIAQQEKVRRRQLQLEKNSVKIQANDDEITRLTQLRMAESMTIASAASSMRDPFASGSIGALLRYNRTQAERDVRAIRISEAQQLGSLSAEMQASRMRGRSARAVSLFRVVGAAGSAAFAHAKLKPPGAATPATTEGATKATAAGAR